jgi:hypothetical protein
MRGSSDSKLGRLFSHCLTAFRNELATLNNSAIVIAVADGLKPITLQ